MDAHSPFMTRLFLPYAAVLLLGSVLFFHGLGERELSSSHEARAGQNAAVILQTGQWGLPRLFDEQIELQKPPLYYWMIAVVGWLRGEVDASAVRLPAALAALATVLLLLWSLTRCGRPLAGLIAACVLATCWHFTWLARVGRIDMPLTFTVTTALVCFFLGGASWRWRAAGYVAMGVGVLLKGPIALVLVGAVSFAMIVVSDDSLAPKTFLRNVAKRVARGSWWWGAVIVAGVAGPWFIWANVQTGGRLWDVFVIYHNMERGFGSETLAAHPWWFYGMRFWIDALPWSLLAPAACWLARTKGWWRNDPVCRLGLVWLIAIAGLLSLMRFKRADYLLPALPGLALFLGAVAERWWLESRPRWAPLALRGLLLGYAACWGIYVYVQDDTWQYRRAAAEIREYAGPDAPVIFFRAEVHPLAFHLRRPLGTILEWENLEIWANEARPVFFVMPRDCACAWPAHLQRGRLEPVFPLGDLLAAKHDRDLVVMRNGAAVDNEVSTAQFRRW